MLDKCRILYKGDRLAGNFYLFVGILLLISSSGLYLFTSSIGYFYLTVGLTLFAFYCIGKGTFIMYTAKQRYDFFNLMDTLNNQTLDDEIQYTQFRIDKKVKNRTNYTRLVILSSIIAFAGIFTSEKGLISGTAIPIAFISGLEIGIGLLTEFRLREYFRILLKYQQQNPDNKGV